MRRTCVFLLFAFFVLCPVFPVNYFGEKIWLKQPDGTKVEVCVFGNEFYQDVETPDGYTLIRDEVSGEICYALVSSDQMEYASSGIKYQGGETPASVKKIVNQHARISPQSIKTKISEKQKHLGFDKDKMAGSDKIELRTASILPDTIYGIVVLLDFKDVKSDVTKEQVEKFCNGDNYDEFGNSRSVKEYYQWISGGKLTYINYVTDFVTMPQNKSVYDNEKYDPWLDNLKLGFLDTISNVVLSDRFVEKSKLTKISSQIGSNYYLVNIFYAGFPECGWSEGLWPHMAMFGLNIDPKNTYGNPYQMSNLGDELTVGCFIHETAHLVCGWPDFYSYDGLEVNNNIYGIGTQWIGSKTKSPLAPSPYCLDMMGWAKKINITDLKNGELVTLKKEVGNVAVYYGSQETGSSNERYYLEVRDEAPEYLRGKQLKGLFVWHVNKFGSNQFSMDYNGIQLEDCRPATYDDPCFKKGLKTEFNDEGTPSAKWDSGENSGLDIWDISEAGEKMTFRCGRAIDSIQDLSVSQTKGLLNLPFQAQVLSLTNPNQQGELRFRLSKGMLPTGLMLSSEGVITGIPLETGIFSFTIDAFFSTEIIKSQTLTIEILDWANLEGFKGAVNLPDTIEVEDFILGGEGVAYHDNGIGNGNFDTSSVYRPDENVDITLNKRTGQYGVLFEKGEWTRYVVNVETEGWYKLTINFDSLYDTKNRDLLILLNGKDTLVNSIYDKGFDYMLVSEFDDYDQLHFLVNLPEGRHCLKFLARKMMSVDNIIMKKIDYKEGERTPFNGTPISIPGEFNFYDFDYNGIEMDPYYRQYLNDCESRYYRNDLICSRLFQYPNKLSYSISVKETGWYYFGEYININNYGGQPALSIDGSPVLVKIFEGNPDYYPSLKALYAYLPKGDWTLTVANVEPVVSKNNIVKYNKVHKVVLYEDSIINLAKFYEGYLLNVFSPISDCKLVTRGLGKDSLSSGLPKGMRVISEKEYEREGAPFGEDFYEYHSPNLFLLAGIPEETGDFEFEVVISDSVGNIERDTFHLEVQGIEDFNTQNFIRDRVVSVDLPVNLNLAFRTLDDRAVQMCSSDFICHESYKEGYGFQERNNNILTGVPRNVGEYSYEYLVTNIEGVEIYRDTLIIIVKDLSTPFKERFQVPCTIKAIDFDLGGEGSAYHSEASPKRVLHGYREDSVPYNEFNGELYISMQENDWYCYSIEVAKEGYYVITPDAYLDIMIHSEESGEDIYPNELNFWSEILGHNPCGYPHFYFLEKGKHKLYVYGVSPFSRIDIEHFDLFVPYDEISILPDVINAAEFDKGYMGYFDNDCVNTGDFRLETNADVYQTDSCNWVKLQAGESLRYTFKFDENPTENYRVTIPVEFDRQLTSVENFVTVDLWLYYGDFDRNVFETHLIASKTLREGEENSFEISIPDFNVLSENEYDMSVIVRVLDISNSMESLWGEEVLLKEIVFARDSDSIPDDSLPEIEDGFIRLYPNPTNKLFFVDVIREGVSVSVYTAQGMLVDDYPNLKQGGFHFGENLTAGVYLMKVKYQGEVVETKKLIKY